MKQRESLSGDLSVEWHALHSEQLDLRRQLAEDPEPEQQAALVERFQSNRATLAAIERGDWHDTPPVDAEPAAGELHEEADAFVSDWDLDSDEMADVETPARGETEPDTSEDLSAPAEIRNTDPDPVMSPSILEVDDDGSGGNVSTGYAALIGLLALVVAVGGVIVVGNGITGAGDDNAEGAGNGTAPLLQSSSLDLDRQVQLLRARIDELGFTGIAIDVDASRDVVVVAGTVASEDDRTALLATARSTVDSAAIDTGGVVLSSPALPTTGAPTTATPTAPLRRIAVVLPDTRTDFSFSQSMSNSIDALAAARGNIEQTITETARGAQAADAIRRAAAEGYDLVIAHSSGFRPAVDAVAAQYPDVTFAVGTIVEEPTLPNVYTYNVAVEEGGAVLGAAAARATTSGVVGVVGPVPVGTSKRYLDAFEAGVQAEAPGTTVLVTYIGSLNDPSGAANATRSLIDSGADVIAGQGHYLNEAVAETEAAGVLWIGNHVDQAPLAPSSVLASQVYHWDVVLAQIIADLDAGLAGGRNLTGDLANGGLTIELNPNAGPSEAVRPRVEQLVAEATTRSQSGVDAGS
jgi:basic membrane protein A